MSSEKSPLLNSSQAAAQDHSSDSKPFQNALPSLSKLKPVCLTFQEICYEVYDKSKKETKQILKDVSGYAKPGEILAIMGPSGSGKTSLLNIIGARTVCTSGYLMKNARPVTVQTKKNMGFVSQKDYLFPTLTVRETIKCFADLRLEESVTEAAKNARVTELLQLLQLEKVADSYIGDEISKGLSGGERKRVSIACQLVHSPNILLLDEPTSGLDASTAYQVVKILRDLASMGHTVICTIHQPRESLFNMFDRLMMLSQGETFYFGAISDTLKFFSDKGYPCPQYANPADFFIDVLTGTSVTENSKKSVAIKASEFYNNSHGLAEVRNVEKSFGEELFEYKLADAGAAADDEVNYVTGFLHQLIVLTKRSFKNELRNPLSSFVALSRTLFMSILVGALYYRLNLKEPTAVFDRQGCLFFILINVAFSVLASIRLFIEERDIFAQEKNSNMYRTSAYFLSKCVAELPLLVSLQVIFAAITFWMVGLHDSGEVFVLYTLFIFLLAYASASYTVAIGALAQDEKAAVTITPILLTLFLLFGGNTFISTASIPVYFSWIQWISFFRYSTGGVLKAVFDGLVFTSPTGQPCDATCRYPDGASALASFGLADESILRDAIALILISLFFRMVSFIGLSIKFKPVIPKNKAKDRSKSASNSYGSLEP